MVIRSLYRWLKPSGPQGNVRHIDPQVVAAPQASVDGMKLDFADAIRQSTALFDLGKFGESLRVLDESLLVAPSNGELLFERASRLFAWGRSREALGSFLKARDAGFDEVKLYIRLAWCSLWTGLPDEAIRWMRQATEQAPGDWETHFGLGTFLHGRQQISQAVDSFQRALDISPDNPHCLSGLVNCRLAQNLPAEAIKLARHAVALSPGRAVAWNNLAVALVTADQFDEAIAAFRHAEELDQESGDESDEYLNLGICLRDVGRLDAAIEFYERKLPERHLPGPHGHYGIALLTAGRLAEGWSQYEFRWMQEPLRSLRFPLPKPVWSGQDLHGKTVLLRSEQGVGDVIQFIRYAPHVKALGATVVLHLRKGIGVLAEGFPGIDVVVPSDGQLPPFDFYINLLTLPAVFGTDLSTVPAHVPYVQTDKSCVDRWRSRVDKPGKFRVGVVWAGDPGHLRDRYRSIRLNAFAPLASTVDVQFYSLQKGGAGVEAVHPPPGMNLIDLGPDLQDFSDTAAVISILDLVICVDTSVAHLAGALGKPVWVLLPTPADWRWMVGRDDSPWYPTMRLFRQHRQGDWQDVIRRVKDALETAIAHQSTGVGGAMPDPGFEPTPELQADPLPSSRGHDLCRVAESRMGILQYFPGQPLVGDSVRLYGEYLQPQVDLLGRLVRSGANVIEVGTGIGIHALAMASIVGPTGHLFLYEPRPAMRQVLSQNLAANGISNVTLMRRVLGPPPAALTSAGGPAKPRGTEDSDDPFLVPEAIDDLHMDRLDWIKLSDVDHPMDIIAGATETLWRLRPSLFIAIADEVVLDEVSGCLRDFGYRRWRMDVPIFNPGNFNLRDSDIFPGQVSLAIVALPEELSTGSAMDGYRELD